MWLSRLWAGKIPLPPPSERWAAAEKDALWFDGLKKQCVSLPFRTHSMVGLTVACATHLPAASPNLVRLLFACRSSFLLAQLLIHLLPLPPLPGAFPFVPCMQGWARDIGCELDEHLSFTSPTAWLWSLKNPGLTHLLLDGVETPQIYRLFVLLLILLSYCLRN